MSQRKPGVQRRRLAARLRDLREQTGVSVETVLSELDWSRSKLSRIETAASSISVPDVRAICDLAGASPELREQLVEMSKAAKKRGWWHSYAGNALVDYFEDYVALESDATSVINYEIDLIPGLLQTEDYARSIIAAWTPDIDKEIVQGRTELRVARQKRVNDGLKLWAVVDEAALRRGCGDEEVMRAQVRHMREMAERPNITLQVLPFDAGPHIAMGTAFTLLDFAGLYDSVVYIDNLTSALYLEDEAEVERYALAAEHLRAIALDPRLSVKMLDKFDNELAR
ncbi:helix-turn-helix domain-containing protein [Saccharopolyspora pogona]|uniref:helix-turn-helix domain-containing protein n=1 Tax=Saccharopolyspora pogona TaxID=333966 RepID=UPI00168598AF|nr:helix-turn-helix transcriptional regulator [Saccharopolyspora pogona]